MRLSKRAFSAVKLSHAFPYPYLKQECVNASYMHLVASPIRKEFDTETSENEYMTHVLDLNSELSSKYLPIVQQHLE